MTTTIAIVGSRRRTDRASIIRLVAYLQTTYGYMEIISGGCRGPDTWAIEAAERARIPTHIYRPNFPQQGAPYHAIVEACYARNQQVAEACDILFAFVAPDRRGGTEDTIRRATRLNKRVVIL